MSESLAVQQLFVYGTLMSHFDNPMAYVIESHCQVVGKGTIPGKMYYIREEFPAAFYDEDSDTKICGQIFTIAPESFQLVMRLLDQYEGFHEKSPEKSLFVRTIVTVQADNHQVPCWTYLYNKSIKGQPQIPTGNFWEFLKEQNLHRKS